MYVVYLCRSPNEKNHQSKSLSDIVMQMWIKRRHILIHDYSLVGYLMALHPSIMQHCLVNKTMLHAAAAVNLVLKLLLNPALVGMDKEREKARLINTFHAEYRDYTCRMGHFACVRIWVSA
jgi:hypothetical protein